MLPGRLQESRGDAAPREMAATRRLAVGDRIRLTGRLLHPPPSHLLGCSMLHPDRLPA
jgi:hypothetical protein